MSYKESIARTLAGCIQAMQNCRESNNTEWYTNHREQVLHLVKETAPSGSGIDCGTEIDLDKSTPEKLVFTLSYHHMNEHGSYDGWTNHTIVVKPSLVYGLTLTISGRERNQTKEYLHEIYIMWLKTEIDLADYVKP